uniref:Uncharacterized protein n=1 Tax=Hyaloperonospora arabidopsidis (strain Emoy2) TaxID=559515 RepID=M4BZY9_HYAAE
MHQDVATRWNSTALMLKRVVNFRYSITATFMSPACMSTPSAHIWGRSCVCRSGCTKIM